ncbi:MAG: twin-arginine translocase subunit TatC [Candidatus Omnitrophica bacterium]|nr:twin-arginine translocase subunit TatC [Candidatus Omnitrophota bacterium]
MADSKMTLVEHLDELRRRILVSAAAVVICSALAFWKVRLILSLLMFPSVDHLNFFSPAEAFLEYCKLAFIAGLFLASPVVLYQLWAFVSAGLNEKEKKVVMFALPFSATLFLGGVVFAYSFVVPWALRFLINFPDHNVFPILSISEYLSFVIMMLLSFGIAFELPVVVMILSKLGIVTPSFLNRNRKFAVIVIFIAAAVITPTPDAFTQCLMAVPMLVLYELSIWISKLVYKKGDKK